LDGRSLVFFAGGARGLRLWRLPIREGARPQEIAGHNLANAFPLSEVRVLQEGLFVASEFERNGVFRLDGSRAPVLLTTETHARGFIPAWNVIRGRLYYIFAEDPQTQRLYWRPAGGGSRTHVADIGRSVDPIGSLDVDPRTGDFVYSTIISEEYDIGLARLRQSGGSWSQK
jgi:hypothetical protein